MTSNKLALGRGCKAFEILGETKLGQIGKRQFEADPNLRCRIYCCCKPRKLLTSYRQFYEHILTEKHIEEYNSARLACGLKPVTGKKNTSKKYRMRRLDPVVGNSRSHVEAAGPSPRGQSSSAASESVRDYDELERAPGGVDIEELMESSATASMPCV